MRLERGQQLIDRSSRLLVGRLVPALSDRVELVEEEQARQVLKRRFESLVDVPCGAADERGDEIARRNVDEVQPVLAGDRVREEGLADPGRAVKQDAVPVDSVTLRVLRVLEHEADGVADLLLQLLHPADVGERGQVVGRLHLEVTAPVTAAHHPAAQEAPQAGSGPVAGDGVAAAGHAAARRFAPGELPRRPPPRARALARAR